MKKIIIILAGLLFTVQANAFYTTYSEDLAKIEKTIYASNASKAEKEKAMKEVLPIIKKIRAKAFGNVAVHCVPEAKKYCPKAKTDEEKVKCLSKKPLMLSGRCLQGFKRTYKK